MMTEWRETTFGECAIRSNEVISPSNVDDVCYIGLEHIVPSELRLATVGLSSEVTSAKTRFKRDDILFGKLRPYFKKIVFAPSDGLCSTDIWVVRAREGTDQRYLFYRMATDEFVAEATMSSEGTRMPRANWKHLEQFKIPRFEFPEQRAIAGVLGVLDDRIAANRRMAAVLEGMARALFTDWFVDFGPTCAKMAGATPYLAPEIWDLFPDRLDPATGLPERWEMKPLGSFFDLVMGQSPPSHTYNERGDGLPFFQGRTDFGKRFPTNRKYCSAPTRIANAGDTLVSVRAPVGDMNLAMERCCIGRGVAALRHKSGSAEFTYYCAASIQSQIQLYEHTGTVFGSIAKTQFNALHVLEPPAPLIEAFASLVAPMDDQIRTTVLHSRSLARMRDLLLTPLMSGQLRVATADQKAHSPTPTQQPEEE